jgi:RNA polymerase sigma-70 factor, ECF subfamily
LKPDEPPQPSNPVMPPAAPPSTVAPTPAPGAQAAPLRPASGAVPVSEQEGALVERARQGDEEAFAMLVELHKDRAYGLALRITRSREDAQDVAQEAFVRAWLALPRFRGESAFGTWLHRIVARRALDRATSLKSRLQRESAVEDLASLPAGTGPARDASVTLRLERLMDDLTPAQRAAVTLFYWEDRPVEEIARALGMPENTVKTHLSRARAALRDGWMREEGTR